MKVEVDVLGSPSLIILIALCGRKATLNLNCVKVEVDVLGSVRTVSVETQSNTELEAEGPRFDSAWVLSIFNGGS